MSIRHEGDVSSTLTDIAATRPEFTGDTNPDEMLEWAVVNLEAAGLYPDKEFIRAVLGRRLLRDTTARLNRIFAKRGATSAPAAVAEAPDAELREVFLTMRGIVRRKIEGEFDHEYAALRVKADEVADARIAFQEEVERVKEQAKLAEALRESVARELEEGRQERAGLQQKITELTVEIATRDQAIARSQSIRERDAADIEGLRTEVAELLSRDASLASALTKAEALKAQAEESATEQHKVATMLRAGVSKLESRIAAEQDASTLLRGEIATARKRIDRLTNTHAQATTRLGRERQLYLGCRDQLKAVQGELEGALREAKRADRAAVVAGNELAHLLEIVKSLKEERDGAKVQQRRSRTRRRTDERQGDAKPGSAG